MNKGETATHAMVLEAECPHCHSIYEVTPQEIGTTDVCVKCNKKFKIAKRKLSPQEIRNQQIKAWQQENTRAEEKWKQDVALWEKNLAVQKARYQKELVEYEQLKLNYIRDLTDGLLCKCGDRFEFSVKRGEVVYRQVSNVSLEESRGVRRTESHRSSYRNVDWSDDWDGRKRRLGDSSGYDGSSESWIDYEFQTIDTGNVYVTNQRFLFIGHQCQRNLPHDKVLAFDYDWVQGNGTILVRAENHQRAMRFSDGDFFEFALVMLVIRDHDFRNFLMSGPRVEVRKWLDDYNAFPKYITSRKPQQPQYAPKPEKETVPLPGLTTPTSNWIILGKTILILVGVTLGIVIIKLGIVIIKAAFTDLVAKWGPFIKAHPFIGIGLVLVAIWQSIKCLKSR